MNGTTLELYTYWGNGTVRYKDEYHDVGGVWTWFRAASYTETGEWDGAKTRDITGAPETYSLPDKPELAVGGSLMLAGTPRLTEELVKEATTPVVSEDAARVGLETILGEDMSAGTVYTVVPPDPKDGTKPPDQPF